MSAEDQPSLNPNEPEGTGGEQEVKDPVSEVLFRAPEEPDQLSLEGVILIEKASKEAKNGDLVPIEDYLADRQRVREGKLNRKGLRNPNPISRLFPNS
jgi:hypothetical protein